MNNTQKAILKQLPEVLLPWFSEGKRPLPWRETKEPYHVWLSEIMLQQTRVEAVKGYFTRFLEALPDICALAAADEALLLKLWEGLGYYSRVRNLKKAACIIESTFGGQFPTSYDDILSLPGIGPYTAGAICSICFEQKTPAVDGNVMRVLSRLLTLPVALTDTAAKGMLTKELAKIYPEKSGDFTQSLMELGATVCVPNGAPFCAQCPAKHLCLASKKNAQLSYPLRKEKKERRKEQRTVFLLLSNDTIALNQRPKSGLLAGLWEFPNCFGALSPSEALSAVSDMGGVCQSLCFSLSGKHIFTHIEWEMTAYCIQMETLPKDCTAVTKKALEEEFALPTAFRQFVDKLPDF